MKKIGFMLALRGLMVLIGTMNAGMAYSVQILDSPTMGIPGLHTFRAQPSAPEAAISWQVDLETRSESGGPSLRMKKNVYTATGQQATFDLKKIKDKQTTWIIRATDSGGSDVTRTRIFLPNRLSSFMYRGAGNPVMKVFFVAPATLSSSTRFLFVMHGANRDANVYCGYWRKWASEHNTLVVCRRFDEQGWNGAAAYNRGNIFADDNHTILNPVSRWSFTVVEQLHEFTRSEFGLNDDKFDIWGHSAGGQFVTRFLLFKPHAKVRLAMPANPGWYLMPSVAELYPCGPKHAMLNFTEQDLLSWSQRNAILFRGTLDTDPSAPETGGCMDAQGKGRYARAGAFYAAMKAMNPQTVWRLIDVINVSHDGEQMSYAAQRFLAKH